MTTKPTTDDVVEMAVRSVVDSDESYRVLPDGTWLAGGCGILADALVDVWTYHDARRYLIRDAKSGVVHHVLAKIGRYYYDANGRATKQRLIEYWRKEEGLERPLVEPLNDWPEGIRRDNDASDFVAGMIREFFSRRAAAQKRNDRNVG